MHNDSGSVALPPWSRRRGALAHRVAQDTRQARQRWRL